MDSAIQTTNSQRDIQIERELELKDGPSYWAVSTGFPLKGSFKGDIDIGIDIDVDTDIERYMAVSTSWGALFVGVL